MGYSSDVDEGPFEAKRCFNPAKSWQLGWYDQDSVEIFPLSVNWSGKVVGVGNYDSSAQDETVILKMDGGSDDDYYVGFNHAIGFHVGTAESRNKVTIVTQGSGNSESSKIASLGEGESYLISNYLNSEDITIKVTEIVTGGDGYAMVLVYQGEGCGECCYASDCYHQCATATCPVGTCVYDASTCPGGTFPPTTAPTTPPYPSLQYKGNNGDPESVYPLQICQSGKSLSSLCHFYLFDIAAHECLPFFGNRSLSDCDGDSECAVGSCKFDLQIRVQALSYNVLVFLIDRMAWYASKDHLERRMFLVALVMQISSVIVTKISALTQMLTM